MSPDKSPQKLFNEALERQDAGERARFLDDACGTDTALRERVERLLRAHDEAGGFFSNPSKVSPSAQASDVNTLPVTEKPGDRIGRYKLLQQIGEGGCGVVYMAEQEDPVRRRVALKVIKLGMDTKQVIARFEAERQALAMMDHPNIARVLDAGATDSGRPFFVMELVRGTKITEFCDEKELSTAERLDLFLKVCSAIQHAHQKGVIHRDVKPSNILVTVVDGVAVPKVIDFGVAKATNNQPLTDKTLFTAFEQFIGTPAYMSPEQAEMSGVDIDTRTDIYSLGVVLYELLTGGPPFDQKKLLAAGLDAMRRTIREEEAPRPSNRLSTMAANALTATARQRHAEPPKLIHQVRGDLDWIAMKCLEKDRARRYETANALAADIRRHLDNEPVVARPPSRWYEFQKTVRRHKFGFGAATALILVLTAGLLASIWQAVRATKAENLANDRLTEVAAERDAKEQARKEAEAVSTFMSEVIRSPVPKRDGRTIQVVELLDRAAKKLETDLAGQPEQKAKLQAKLASSYYELGLYREAIPLQEKVRDYYLTKFGLENSRTLSAMVDLANSYFDAGRRNEALKLREQVLALRRKVNGPEHSLTLSAMNNIANSYFFAGRRDKALELREEVLALYRQANGPENPDTLGAMINLADSYFFAGRRDEALKLQEEVLALYRKLSGPEDPDTLAAMHNVANSYSAAGRLDEALKLREEVLALRRKVNGPEHGNTLAAMSSLSDSYYEVGRKDEALQLREEVLAIRRRVNGPEHLETIGALHDLVSSYAAAGRKEEALKLLEEEVALRLKAGGPKDPGTLPAMLNLAASYIVAGRVAEAVKLNEEALALHRKVLGPDNLSTLRAMISLAGYYRAADRVDEAVKLGQSCLELYRHVSGPTHPKTLKAMTELAISYEVAGRTAEAIALEEQSLRLKREHLPPEHPMFVQSMVESMENLATCYEKTNRKAEAEALRQEARDLKAKAKDK